MGPSEPPNNQQPMTNNQFCQFDSGVAANWQGAFWTRWQLFYFRWNPATRLKDRVRVQLARSR
jgi:hypothetical protein